MCGYSHMFTAYLLTIFDMCGKKCGYSHMFTAYLVKGSHLSVTTDDLGEEKQHLQGHRQRTAKASPEGAVDCFPLQVLYSVQEVVCTTSHPEML